MVTYINLSLRGKFLSYQQGGNTKQGGNMIIDLYLICFIKRVHGLRNSITSVTFTLPDSGLSFPQTLKLFSLFYFWSKEIYIN